MQLINIWLQKDTRWLIPSQIVKALTESWETSKSMLRLHTRRDKSGLIHCGKTPFCAVFTQRGCCTDPGKEACETQLNLGKDTFKRSHEIYKLSEVAQLPKHVQQEQIISINVQMGTFFLLQMDPLFGVSIMGRCHAVSRIPPLRGACSGKRWTEQCSKQTWDDSLRHMWRASSGAHHTGWNRNLSLTAVGGQQVSIRMSQAAGT